MDTSRYRAFVAAVETGSFRDASVLLGYTPSAVSQLLQSLEKDLGLTLFVRSKKGVKLTTSGEALLPIVKRILEEEDILVQTAAGINGIMLGQINIAAYHSLSTAWMPKVMGRFHMNYPDVQLNLYEGTQMDIADRLMTGKADIAFFNDSSMAEKHDWIPLYDDEMVAVLPASHPMAEKKRFPVSAFRGERFIMPEHGFDYDVIQILKWHHITPQVHLSTFDSYVLLEMVGQGLGVSMVNRLSLGIDGPARDIAVLPLDPPYSIKMGVALISLKEASPAVLKFIDYAREMIIPAEP